MPKDLKENEIYGFSIPKLYNFPIGQTIPFVEFHTITDSESIGLVELLQVSHLREENNRHSTSGLYKVLSTNKVGFFTPKEIKVEFNPDLALRPEKYLSEGRDIDELLPEKLVAGENHIYLKKGQRNYWLDGEIPLSQTEGEGKLSRPLASVLINSVIHFSKDYQVWTRGCYTIVDVFDPKSSTIQFEGMNRIKK